MESLFTCFSQENYDHNTQYFFIFSSDIINSCYWQVAEVASKVGCTCVSLYGSVENQGS